LPIVALSVATGWRQKQNKSKKKRFERAFLLLVKQLFCKCFMGNLLFDGDQMAASKYKRS
jgi:hypothetical protein